MEKINIFLLALLFIFIPLYPKFPLVGVAGSFVYIRLEDFLILGVSLVLFLHLIKNKFTEIKTPLGRAAIIYLIVGFAATFSGIFLTKTADLQTGLLHSFRRVEYLSLLIASLAFLKTENQLKFLTKTIIIVSAVVAIFGLGQLYWKFPVISTTNTEFAKGLALGLGPEARINSTFAGHYDLAAFSVFPIFLILALIPQSKHKIPLLIIAAMSYWTLLLSASRITFFSFFAGAFILLIAIRRKIWLIPLGFAAIAGVLISPQLRGRYLQFFTSHVTVSIVSPVQAQDLESVSKDVATTPDALKPTSQPEDRSFNIRIQVEWPRALRSAMKNPVFGTGYSSVGLAVDNDYLRILAETGALGLAAFGLIFFRFYKTAIPIAWRYKATFSNAFIVAVSCTIFSILINSVFIDVFAASKIAMICWGAIGLAEKAKSFKS